MMWIALTGGMFAQRPLQADLKLSFARAIEQFAMAVDGVVGYIVTDLTSGETGRGAVGAAGVSDGLDHQAIDSV